jgi:hypothetical protein
MGRDISFLPRRSSFTAFHLLISRWLRSLLRGGHARGRRAMGPRGRRLFLEPLETRYVPSALTLNPGTLPADTINVPYSQAAAAHGMQNPFYASQVVSYVPGTLADPSYDDPRAALGGLNSVAGSFAGTNYYLTPFDPAFGPSNLVEIGAGGSLTLQLAQPASTNGYTIGVHTGLGLTDADYPNGVNTNPASYTNSWLRQADVLVSADGVNWGDLGTITFDNPSNYDAGSATDPAGLSPGVGPLANPGEPFLGSLSSFNGQNWQGTLAVLNGSAGGTWLNLSGVTDGNGNPIAEVNYIRFVVPSSPPVDPSTGNPELMMVDAVVGINTAATITADGGTGATTVGFTITVGSIPAGLSFTVNGNQLLVAGTPTATGSVSFDVTATDSAMTTTTQSYTLVINPAISLSPGSVPSGSVGMPYSQTITASNGTGVKVLSYVITASTIPAGLTLTPDANQLAITGTPTASGTFSFDVTATDEAGATATQSYTLTVNPGPADHISFSEPATFPAGVPFQVTVTVEDAYNNTVTGYTGTVNFTLNGTLARTYTFTPADQGSHTFPRVTLTQAGSFTVTATDAANPAITGSTSFTVVPAAPDHIALIVTPTIPAGTPFSITVTVQDAYGNTVTGYAGTIHFTLTGPVMPTADYTFTTTDIGTHAFSNLVLRQSGLYTLTATDAADPDLTGSVAFAVGPA